VPVCHGWPRLARFTKLSQTPARDCAAVSRQWLAWSRPPHRRDRAAIEEEEDEQIAIETEGLQPEQSIDPVSGDNVLPFDQMAL
jgi:hypothetical protein